MSSIIISADYSNLFKLMKRKNISQNKLIKEYGFTSRMFMNMKLGGNVQMDTILKLAKILEETNIANIVTIKVIQKGSKRQS